jgi:hypothetical protein
VTLALAVLLAAGCSGGGGGGPSGEVKDLGGPGGATPPPGTQLKYVGSATCAQCHADIYASFLNTGHNYKLNKVVNGTVPRYPYSDISGALERISDDNETERRDPEGNVYPSNGTLTDNERGTPTSYWDISYVIGGYGWKARWMDLDGYIITGKQVQYNLEDGSMSAYSNNVVNKPFDCGDCHTTGWRHFDPVNNPNRQDNRPGIEGTWELEGIQCEACHGPGSLHVAAGGGNITITRKAQGRTVAQMTSSSNGWGLPVACGECHTRDGEKNYPDYVSSASKASQAAGGPEIPMGGRIAASGGFIQHHEQYDELLAIDPANVAAGSTRKDPSSPMWDCMTCHDPHKNTKYNGGGARGKNSDCLVCHQDYSPSATSTIGMRNLNCTDCHMPKMVKSAISKPAVGLGPATGDIRVHIFRIDLTRDPSTQFTADGKFANPYITRTYACFICHNGVTNSDKTDLDFSTYKFHDNIP